MKEAGETFKEKKELKVYQVKNSNLWKVKYVGGGELPDALKQSWTSYRSAQYAIELYNG